MRVESCTRCMVDLRECMRTIGGKEGGEIRIMVHTRTRLKDDLQPILGYPYVPRDGDVAIWNHSFNLVRGSMVPVTSLQDTEISTSAMRILPVLRRWCFEKGTGPRKWSTVYSSRQAEQESGSENGSHGRQRRRRSGTWQETQKPLDARKGVLS